MAVKPLSKICDPLIPIRDAWDFTSEVDPLLALSMLEIAISNRPYIDGLAWTDEKINKENDKEQNLSLGAQMTLERIKKGDYILADLNP